MTDLKWPSVEDATRRINVLIEGQVEGPEADMAARDLIVLMRELGRVTDENRRLREALQELVSRLDKVHADPNYESVWTVHQIHAGPYIGPTYTVALDRARAALAAEPAGGKAEDRAQDAMRAQVYPDLWPGPSVGQTAPPPPPTQDEVVSVPQLEQLRECLSEFGSNGLDASTCLGLVETIAALRQRAERTAMISDDALEAAMLAWYGPDWRERFFPRHARDEVPRVMDAMRRAIEAANAVTFRDMPEAALKDKP